MLTVEKTPSGYWVDTDDIVSLVRAGYRTKQFDTDADARTYLSECKSALAEIRKDQERINESYVLGEWDRRPNNSEQPCRCIGCGGTFARAECSAKRTENGFVFACSPECED